MEYGRDGNTVDHPDSTWTMESVSVNDGRPGDGADVQKVEYDYAGLKYDRVHRQSLGYATITAREMDVVPNPDVALRTTTTEYFNDSVFTAGLQKSVTVDDAGEARRCTRRTTTWNFRDVRNIAAGFDVLAQVTPVDVTLLGATDTVASRGRSIAPMVTASDEYWYEGGNADQVVVQHVHLRRSRQHSHPVRRRRADDPNDDVLVTTDYADCLSAASSDLGCMDAVDPPNVNTSPIFSDNLCPTWVSLPVEVTVTNGLTGAARKVYRHRDGRGDVCDNASMTHHEETRNAAGDIGATELTYDEWGSYDRIVYPAGPDDMRYAVHYEWDDDGHGKIAQVTEYDLYDIPDNSCDLETYIANAEDADSRQRVVTPGDVCDAVDIFMLDDPLSLDDLTRFTPAASYPPFDLGGHRQGHDVERDVRPAQRSGRLTDRREREHDRLHLRLARTDQDDQQPAAGGHQSTRVVHVPATRGRLRLRIGEPPRHLPSRRHDRHVHVRRRDRADHADQA